MLSMKKTQNFKKEILIISHAAERSEHIAEKWPLDLATWGTMVILESSFSGVQSGGSDLRDRKSKGDKEDGAEFV